MRVLLNYQTKFPAAIESNRLVRSIVHIQGFLSEPTFFATKKGILVQTLFEWINILILFIR